jgi:YbbR domain-containing protein
MKWPVLSWLTENLAAKLMSLLIAFLLWVALIDEPELVEIVTVPIEYRNLAQNLELSPDMVTRVQLQVRGPRGRLNEVSSETTNIVLDLSAMRQSSTSTFTIQESNLNLPLRVRLLRATPSQVRVKLEKRSFLNVSVVPDFEQNLPEDTKIASFDVSPPTVQVVGPESRVKAIATLKTEPIDLRSIESGKPIRLNVILTDSELAFSGPSQVTVKVLTELKPTLKSPSK